MTTPISADPEYVLGRNTTEYERLVLQARYLNPATERLFRAAGMELGMRVLDVGSGIGDVAFVTAKLVGPGGSVVGVDLDEEALAAARRRAAVMNLTNIEFVHGDVRSMALDRSFDAAVGRLVLMYTADPTETLRTIADSVRCGGLEVFQELAAKTFALAPHQVELPVLKQTMKWTLGAFDAGSIDVDTGVQLYEQMQSVGLTPEPLPIVESFYHNEPDDFVYRYRTLAVRSLLPTILKLGLATEAEIDIDTLEQCLRDEAHAANVNRPWMLLFGQWARKP
jgi:ubiquinone/menaquinone biosynthesis C-methylase UbiE